MFSLKKHPLLAGTILLTGAGVLSRFIGFFYRIFLSRIIGAEGMGIYQMVFPVYTLFAALTTTGIQSFISRFCSADLAQKNRSHAKMHFFTGLFFSLSLSVLAGIFLYCQADRIAVTFFKEDRCSPLLRIIAFSLPFASLHNCICSWYYARGKAGFPAFSQLVEQIVRVTFSYLMYVFLLQHHEKATVSIAAAGILTGEISSAVFMGISFFFHSHRYPWASHKCKLSLKKVVPELLLFSFPLTLNKVLPSLLQSIEAVLLPFCLRSYGFTSSQSLAAYGILTGMALPFILFPSAITTSLSTMMLPSISGDQAVGNQNKILEKVTYVLRSCFSLGILFTGIFFFFGNALGECFYNNPDAGIFLQTLSFLCPFLYVTTALNSILNGLGHTFLCLFLTLTGILIRLVFILAAVPKTGLSGYMTGLILSNLLLTGLTLFFLRKLVPFHFSFKNWILKPLLEILIGCGWGLCARYFLTLGGYPDFFVLAASIFISGFLYLLLEKPLKKSI